MNGKSSRHGQNINSKQVSYLRNDSRWMRLLAQRWTSPLNQGSRPSLLAAELAHLFREALTTLACRISQPACLLVRASRTLSGGLRSGCCAQSSSKFRCPTRGFPETTNTRLSACFWSTIVLASLLQLSADSAD